MRKKMVAGNWKMHMEWNESMTFLAELIEEERGSDWSEVEVLIAPPFPYLRSFFEFKANAKSAIGLGAQNCAFEAVGAFTGEVSASMIKNVGAEAVILGHSERRAIFGETPETIGKKVVLALSQGLKPIFCCGEQLEDRENGKTEEVLAAQLEGSIFQLSREDAAKLVIAYEPVWAIGTGRTASPDQAQETHAFIRKTLANHFDQELADSLEILYGGSVKPGNAGELFQQPDIDGGLIGGASLKVQDFSEIIKAAL